MFRAYYHLFKFSEVLNWKSSVSIKLYNTSASYFTQKHTRTVKKKASENRKNQNRRLDTTSKIQSLYECLANLKNFDSLYTFHIHKVDSVWEAKINVEWPESCSYSSYHTEKGAALSDCFAQLNSLLEKYNFLNEDRPNWLKIFCSLYDVEPNADLKKIKSLFCKTYESSGLQRPKFLYSWQGIHWKCSSHLAWPISETFIGYGNSKTEAEAVTIIQILKYLRNNDHVDKEGYIVQYSKEDSEKLKASWSSGYEVKVQSNIVEEINDVVARYQKWADQMSEKLSTNIHKEENHEELDDQINIMTGRPLDNFNPQGTQPRFNEGLSHDDDSSDSESRYIKSLPVYQSRSKILEAIDKNQVTIICGGTGCGKSTQVPQFILDYCSRPCNVVVTQPRRISAISLAERIASDRGERVGASVGYQVRLEGVRPPDENGVLFCTVGILLRRLQLAPKMKGITHVVVDEVHERGVDIDFLLIVLKKLLRERPDLKVILMSASLNPQKFSSYFNNAPILNIEGRTFPVHTHYLEDCLNLIASTLSRRYPHDIKRQLSYKNVNYELVVDTVLSIHKSTPCDGSILCFLPGWQEIKSVQEILRKFGNTFYIVPLHSQLSPSEQRLAFSKPPPGVRKVLLSTNIAETSITIDDVVYVVDLGLHKEKRFNSEKGTATMDVHWISRANAVQRQGRAGRVKPGVCYRLYTEEQHDQFFKFPIPEIHRIPLEKVVLDAKSLNPSVSAEKFLSQAIEPPSLRAIHHAVQELKDLDILDTEETLTPLGSVVSGFSTHPRLSRALVYGWFLKCINPVLTMVSVLSADKDPFISHLDNRAQVRSIKKSFHPTSDHLAYLNLFQQWKQQSEQQSNFCSMNSINIRSLRNINGIRRIISDELVMSQLFGSSQEILGLASNDVSEDVVLSCLCAGLAVGPKPQVLWTKRGTFRKGKIDWDDCKVYSNTGVAVGFYADTVNKSADEIPSGYDLLMYFSGMYSKERRSFMVRETSCIPSLAFVLFGGKNVAVQKNGSSVMTFDSQKHYRFACDERLADALISFRRVIRDAVNYSLLSRTNHVEPQVRREMQHMGDEVTRVFYKLLTSQSEAKMSSSSLQS